jgi:NADPH2:quinone reductase
LPFVIGSEVCGTVEALGGRAGEGFSVGDRVASAAASGAYAEFATAPAFLTAKVPDGVTSDVAASVLLKGLTAEAGGRYPLSEAGRAHEDLQGRKTAGSIVLLP